MQPKISVLIPVFKTSQYLAECLQHIRLTGSFLLPKDVEIVLVNDGSFEERKICKKELKTFTKETKIPHQYIEHRKNLGLIEARRRPWKKFGNLNLKINNDFWERRKNHEKK